MLAVVRRNKPNDSMPSTFRPSQCMVLRYLNEISTCNSLETERALAIRLLNNRLAHLHTLLMIIKRQAAVFIPADRKAALSLPPAQGRRGTHIRFGRNEARS
jgi:hypothetical protein